MTPNIPSELIALIKKSESCRLSAYRCPAGVWTCGWGSTGADVTAATRWTQAQADARLAADMMRFVADALRLSPGLAKQTSGRLAAIADFCYNAGSHAYEGSTLRRKVDAGDWAGAKAELAKWIHAKGEVLPGLVKRRAAEAVLLGN
jgi:lysozyme